MAGRAQTGCLRATQLSQRSGPTPPQVGRPQHRTGTVQHDLGSHTWGQDKLFSKGQRQGRAWHSLGLKGVPWVGRLPIYV